MVHRKGCDDSHEGCTSTLNVRFTSATTKTKLSTKTEASGQMANFCLSNIVFLIKHGVVLLRRDISQKVICESQMFRL